MYTKYLSEFNVADTAWCSITKLKPVLIVFSNKLGNKILPE